MGLTVCILLAVIEILFAVWRCRKGKEDRGQYKKRLIVRAVEVLVIIAAMLLPFGQKWRFAPVLGLLLLLLVIALIVMLARRNKEMKPKKSAGIITACVLQVILFGVFLIPAFVFTGYKGLPVSGSYPVREASAILVDTSRTDPFETDGSSREVPVHFYYPEAGEGSAEQFPLVIFSHGAFGYYQSNTSTYMELASNGYVVASLDHPHHAFFTKDTDGKMVLVDRGFLNEAMKTNDESVNDNPEEQFELFQKWMALRTADMNFALDEMEEAVQNGAPDDSWFLPEGSSDAVLAALHMADTSRIGLMGHSMGGATSVALGRGRDDVAAVIDIDGTMLSEYTGVQDGKYTVNEEPYDVPVLEFKNWESNNELEAYIEEYRAEGGRYPNDELMRHAAAGYSITIRDTKHMDFTDLPLLSPVLGNLLGSGERDTAETMTIVNELVLQFYNCYLKGEGTFTAEECY